MIVDIPLLNQSVYEVTLLGYIWERKIVGYHCNTSGKQKGEWYIIESGCGLHSKLKIDDMNTTYFLTKEEAEQAAKSIKDNKDG